MVVNGTASRFAPTTITCRKSFFDDQTSPSVRNNNLRDLLLADIVRRGLMCYLAPGIPMDDHFKIGSQQAPVSRQIFEFTSFSGWGKDAASEVGSKPIISRTSIDCRQVDEAHVTLWRRFSPGVASELAVALDCITSATVHDTKSLCDTCRSLLYSVHLDSVETLVYPSIEMSM